MTYKKNKIFVFYLFLMSFNIFSQEKETIIIKKENYHLYQGVLSETKSWYLLVDFENYYLANIDKPNDEVFDWFMKFKDSQNIYKYNSNPSNTSIEIGGNQLKTIHFKKENEPTDSLSFYIEKPYKDSIILISLADNSIYKFQLIK